MKRFFKTMAFTLLGLVLSMNLMADNVTFGSDWNSLFGTSYSGTISSVKANSLTLEGTVSNVSFVVTNGTSTNGYVKTDDFRAYNGYTITITAPTNNNITAISSTKGGKTFSSGVSANVGTLSISNNAISWSGSSNSVVLSCSGTVSFKTITVTYSSSTTPSGPTLESIYFTDDAATKLSYTEGDVFDPAGLVVMGKYSEGDDKDVTDDVEWSFSPETLAKTTTSVTVTASIDGVDDAQKVVNDLTVAAAPKYTKVTANKTDWSGEYLLVYEKDGTAYVWTGVDASNSYATAAITSNQIAKPTKAATLTIAAITDGYSIQVSGGDNDGKYVNQTKYDNGMSFSDSPSANTLSHDGTNTVIAGSGASGDSHVTMRYNNTSGQDRFRYYKSGQQAVQLYELVNTDPIITANPTSVTFPEVELADAVDDQDIAITAKNLTSNITVAMKDGSAEIFEVTPASLTITEGAFEGNINIAYLAETTGEYSGTIVLTSGETSIEIPVSASVVAHIPVLQSIYVSGEPNKKEYTVGDAFETAGLEVWGKYDEGEDQPITENIEWEVTPATFSATTETSVSVVATALEKTSEAFVVTGLTVAAAPQIATYDFTTNLYGHTGVSSGTDNHDGDIAVNEIFTEAPTQIKFIKAGSTVTRFWSNKGTSELRIYKDAEFTISSTDYNITKVEFAGTVNLKVGETTVSGNTWTGKQKSVTFVNTNSNSALTGITVTYEAAAPSAATPTITPSATEDIYWEPITVTLATTTEEAAIYYTTNGTTPAIDPEHAYSEPINISATTTIKAIAVKDGLDNSEVATKTFNFGPVFTSLEDLAAADISKGTTVKVSFENVPIKSIFVTQQGYRNGIYFDIQKGEKDIEIFYQNVPESWVAEGTVSGTMICPWTEYNGTWELAPAANSWNWSNLTYNAPAVTGLTKVEVEGAPDKTTYVDGEKFKPAGLTIYATIDDVRAEYDGSKGEVIYTVTPETLTESTTSVSVVATIGTISSEAYIVNGLTVNAIQESTIADFISNEGGRCYLIGEITSAISNGSFTLTDASGSIYVYKHTLNGVTSIAQGDYIKVIADEYEYYQSKTHEAKNVVVIEKPEKPQVDVEGISLNKTETTITAGKTETLVATIAPANASDKEVIWTSSNEAVATVADGVVTAVAAGDAVITAKSHENEEITATCNVTVVAAQVKYFALATGTADLDAAVTNGKKVVIAPAPSVETAKVMGTYASGYNIAAMDADFNDDFTALEVGEDAFYTIAKDGNYYTFQDGNGKYIYAAGGASSNHLKAYETLDDKGRWNVSITDNVASIVCKETATTRNTMQFNPNNGSPIFACYASASQKNLALYVEAEKPVYVPVESIELSQEEADVMVGKKLTLTATVGPDNATQKGVTWTSNNEKVTVEDGLVIVDAEAEVGATATITATTVGTTTDGGSEHLSATCTVTVVAPVVADYKLVTDASTLQAGDIIVLAATNGDNSYINGDLSGDYLTSVEATITDNVLSTADAFEFVLGGEEGAWTLTSVDGQLGATAVKKLTYDGTQTGFVGTWTINIDENYNATIAPDAEGYGRFLYNVSSPRFLTYTSNTSATMLLPQLYRLIADVKVDGDKNASEIADLANVTVNEGGNLLVTEGDIELGDIYVMEGGKVTIQTEATLTVNNFVIKSSMGAGKSGQVIGVTSTNFTITGSAYYDVVLGDNGNPDKWHAFAVPFNVDAINGVYDLDDNKLTNEVNYAIMDYHGDVRAQGQYGWKKFRGIMNPGVFYLMTVDGERTTYRMKMNGGFQASSSTITVNEYASGTTTDAGWNGIANNQLGYSSLGVNVQVLDPVSYIFETKLASTTNFTVGTPFFYQASADGSVVMNAADGDKPNYAPRKTAEAKNIAVTLGNGNYTDRLYISATDEATNEYQIGRDLVKMTMTNAPAVPQIFAEAYGTKLCMVDAPMMYDEAVYALNLYAPANGEYTMSAAQVEGYEVFLTQNGNVIWNLSMSEATVELTKGNNTEYGLILKAIGAHAPTDINTINGQESVQKFFYNSNIYIRHNNKTFNVQGKLVK